MTTSRTTPSLLLAVGIAAGLALFALRWSVDGPQMSARALRELMQSCLSVSQGFTCLAAWLLRKERGLLRMLAFGVANVSLVVSAGIAVYNGHLASQRLGCARQAEREHRDAVQSREAVAKCFAAAASE